MKRTVVWVVGVGAIGSVVAGKLESDPPCILVDGWDEHVEAIRNDGLAVAYPEGTVTVRLPAYRLDEIGSIDEVPDVILLAVKSNFTIETVKLLLPRMGERTLIVSLQNCINEESIASLAGAERTIGAMVIGFGGELTGPATALSRGSDRRLVIGELDGSLTPRLEELAALLRSSLGVSTTVNIWGVLWSKLIINGEMNAVAAATGLRTDAIAVDPLARRVALGLARELVAVALELGMTLDRAELDGPPEAYLEPFGSAAMRGVERDFIERWRPVSVQPSMLQDVQKRRPTEIDHMNGYAAAKGCALGIGTPFNDAIVRVIKAIEAEREGPQPALFARSLASLVA